MVEPGTYEELVVHRTAGRVEATLPGDVLFDSRSSRLRDDAHTDQALTDLMDLISATPGTVTITGYTDSVGSDSENLVLGRSRAEAVGSWLTLAGIPADRMRLASKGESEPAVPNAATPEELQQNRRVTAVIESESR